MPITKLGRYVDDEVGMVDLSPMNALYNHTKGAMSRARSEGLPPKFCPKFVQLMPVHDS
jgi:hypothetical protein